MLGEIEKQIFFTRRALIKRLGRKKQIPLGLY